MGTTDAYDYEVFVTLAAGSEDGMAVDATPGGYVLQRPRVRADRFHQGPRSQVRDPILDPDYRERTQEPSAIHD